MKTADNKGFSKSDLAQKRLFTRPSELNSYQTIVDLPLCGFGSAHELAQRNLRDRAI